MKKTIKILLALMLVSSTLMSLCPISQAAQDPNLTYELDFSGLDQTSTAADARGLASSCTRTGVTINRHLFPANANPLTVQEIDGVDAIVFGANNGFLIDSTSTTPAFGSKDITFEMWIYKMNTLNGSNASVTKGNFLQLKRGTNGSTEMELYFVGDPTGDNKFQIIPDINSKYTYTYADVHSLKEWEHFVITRTYDTAGTTATTKVYSNGVLKKEYSASNLTTFATPQRIFFGSYNSANNPDVAVAAFRVYDKVLSQTEIKGKFDAEKDTYSDAPKMSNLVTAPNYKTENITLEFDENMPSVIGNSNIVIEEKVSGDEIKTTVSSVDTDNKTVTVSIGQMLKPNTQYVVKYVSNPSSTDPNPFDPEMTFTTQDYEQKATVTPTIETNNLKVVTEFNDASVGKTCCVLAVVYDNTGRMVKLDGTMQSFVVASDNKSCTLNINSTGFTTGYKVKVYAWDMSGIVPMQTMSEPVVVNY